MLSSLFPDDENDPDDDGDRRDDIKAAFWSRLSQGLESIADRIHDIVRDLFDAGKRLFDDLPMFAVCFGAHI